MSLRCSHPLLDAVYHPDCPGCAEAVALVKVGEHPIPGHPGGAPKDDALRRIAGAPVAKQVIVMRKDLNMRKGKMIAQGAHASLGAVLLLTLPDSRWHVDSALYQAFKTWINGTFTKICVSVNSESELIDINARAHAAGLPCKLIEDSGATEFHGVPTLTCLAIGPAWAEGIDKITGDLPLL